MANGASRAPGVLLRAQIPPSVVQVGRIRQDDDDLPRQLLGHHLCPALDDLQVQAVSALPFWPPCTWVLVFCLSQPCMAVRSCLTPLCVCVLPAARTCRQEFADTRQVVQAGFWYATIQLLQLILTATFVPSGRNSEKSVPYPN